MEKTQIAIAEARDGFTRLVHRAERGEVIEITRRGKPVAVIIAEEEYQQFKSRTSSFWDAYIAFREKVDLNELQALDWADVRDLDSGREPEL